MTKMYCPTGHLVVPFGIKSRIFTKGLWIGLLRFLNFKAPEYYPQLEIFITPGNNRKIYACPQCDLPYFDYQCEEINSEKS